MPVTSQKTKKGAWNTFTFIKERINLTSIKLTLTGAQAWATANGPLTSGMVGIPVTIEYDEAWDGLIKNLLCRCSTWEGDSSETRTILNVGETAVVAPEVMQAGQYLYLGVEGFREDGTLVMPTTWARCENLIWYGADSGDDPSADATLPIWNQLQAQIEQINRDGITQERMEELQACAEAATQAAADAARSEQKAAAAASVATSNVNAAESFAIQAQTSEQNAKISASSAANLANGALQAQRAAEAAAQRAEDAAASGELPIFRDVLPEEIIMLDANENNSGNDSGGDDNETDNDDIDIPVANLMAYYDMRTPLTSENRITDLSGNGRNLLFYPANGYYQDGYISRGDRSNDFNDFASTQALTDGAAGKFAYGDTTTIFATFAIGTNDRTPVWGTAFNKMSLVTMTDGMIVYAGSSPGFNSTQADTKIPEDYTIITVAVSLNKSGMEQIYINGGKKTEYAFKTGQEFGTGFYPLTGYNVGGDYNAKFYNAAIYSAELSAAQIAAISATLLANAGGESV